MSGIAKSIRRGLEQAVAFAKREADQRKFRLHPPDKFPERRARADVKAIDKIMKRRRGERSRGGDEPVGYSSRGSISSMRLPKGSAV